MQDPACNEQIVVARSGERRALERVPTRLGQDLLAITKITEQLPPQTEAAKARLHRARSLARHYLSPDPALALA